jgi:hypothetical protein
MTEQPALVRREQLRPSARDLLSRVRRTRAQHRIIGDHRVDQLRESRRVRETLATTSSERPIDRWSIPRSFSAKDRPVMTAPLALGFYPRGA